MNADQLQRTQKTGERNAGNSSSNKSKNTTPIPESGAPPKHQGGEQGAGNFFGNIPLNAPPAKNDISHHASKKIKWKEGTEYLQIENLQKDKTFEVPSIYESQLKKIEKLESEVEVSSENPGSGSASYCYDEKKQKGIIKVGTMNEDYPDDVKKSVLKSKIIAMTHEMQHALDDLTKGSPQEGRLRADGDWYDKIMSELNAHAVQAMVGNEIIASGEGISQNDGILAEGFNVKEFEEGGTMFNKLKSYFSQYKVSSTTALSEKNPEKIRREQVIQFLSLNWGEVKRLIDQVQDSKTATSLSRRTTH